MVLELLDEGLEVAGDVEVAVASLTEWCRVERFRADATWRLCLTGGLTRRVSSRASVAIALAAAARNLDDGTVNAVVAASLPDRMGVDGRTGLPPS